MPTLELTDRFCQAARPIDGRQTDYFDTVVKGLCLRVSPAGTRTWNLIYSRPGNGRRARMKIGRYPEIKLGGETGARQRAKDARAAVGDGQDPIAERQARAAAMTVTELVENYIARHASTKRSGNEIARRLRKNLSGYDASGRKILDRSAGCIGDRKLSELHRRDVTKSIDAVKDRGAHVEANRLFEDVRAMVRWARARGDLDENLMEGMRKPTVPVERNRVLSAEEIAAMWTALAQADMRESTRRVIRLCLVTAQRVGEVSGMTLDELDLDAALWRIPSRRSKNGKEHVVPLSVIAIEIICDQLADVRALSERKGRAVPSFVFAGPGARASVTGAAIAKAIKREETMERGGSSTIMRIAPWTAHDLRRTAATHMEELGISPFIVGHVLNHLSVTRASITSRVYARYSYDKEKRQALDLWADRLAGIIEADDANVVPIGRLA